MWVCLLVTGPSSLSVCCKWAPAHCACPCQGLGFLLPLGASTSSPLLASDSSHSQTTRLLIRIISRYALPLSLCSVLWIDNPFEALLFPVLPVSSVHSSPSSCLLPPTFLAHPSCILSFTSSHRRGGVHTPMLGPTCELLFCCSWWGSRTIHGSPNPLGSQLLHGTFSLSFFNVLFLF